MQSEKDKSTSSSIDDNSSETNNKNDREEFDELFLQDYDHDLDSDDLIDKNDIVGYSPRKIKPEE